MNVQLCIACPNVSAYSETFIKDQIAGLEPGTVIYLGNYPITSKAGDWRLPFPLHIHLVRGVTKKLLPRIFHRLYSNALARYLQQKKITVLLANYGPVAVAVADACRKATVKLVAHFHGYDAYEYQTLDKYKSAYQKLFKQTSALVAVSKEMKQQLVALGADPGKVKLIPYGINLNKFSATDPSKNGAVLINIGRFTPKKAPDLLIKAFKIVQEAIPDARLKMIGGGELLEDAKLLAAELGLTGVIAFLGVQTPEEIIAHLHTARIYVQHSLRPPGGDSEGTPVSILEAGASALPVVSTRHAGIKDAVIEQVSGLLVNEGDYTGMAAAIISLLKDPEKCKQMGIAGRAHIVNQYASPDQINKLEEILS